MQVILAVVMVIGFIGILDVLAFKGRIGVVFAEKIRNLFHRG